MPFSNKLHAYPQAVRNLFYTFASAEEQREKYIPFSNEKSAIRERAKMYQLRKLLAEAAEAQGNYTMAERFYTIGIRLERGPGTVIQLVVYNHHSAFSPEVMDSLAEFDDTSAPQQAPTVTPDEMEEFKRTLAAQAADETGIDAIPYYKSGDN